MIHCLPFCASKKIKTMNDHDFNHNWNLTTSPQGKFLISHTDLSSMSEHTDKNDFCAMQLTPESLQNLLFSCRFKDEHGRIENISENWQ